MSHHGAPEGRPTTGEHLDGSVVYPMTPQEQPAPSTQLDVENLARACEDVRENIDRQLDRLLENDLSMHFTVREILGGLIKIKNSQANNG